MMIMMMMIMIFNSIKILNADKCKDELYKTVKILEVEFVSCQTVGYPDFVRCLNSA
jgi:hypothetical protein